MAFSLAFFVNRSTKSHTAQDSQLGRLIGRIAARVGPMMLCPGIPQNMETPFSNRVATLVVRRAL